MTRRPWRLMLLAGSITAFALGCGEGDKGTPRDTRGIRVAAVIKGLDNPFFVTLRDGLVATARVHGAPLRLAASPAGLQGTAGQASDLENLAEDRADCYVVNPISQSNLVRSLAKIPDGTPIVNVDSLVDRAAAQAAGVKISSYIGTDNVAGGALAADAMAARVGRGARVAVIAGIPGDASSGDRTQGFRQGARGRFDVIETVAADFDREKARLAAEEMLHAHPDVAGFFAVNDLMALGVADAARAAGRQGRLAVVGFDGIREALAAVKRGALSATVAQYPYSMGQLGIEACLAAVGGKSLPANVDAPVQVVTQRNVTRAQANFPRPAEHFDSAFRALLNR